MTNQNWTVKSSFRRIMEIMTKTSSTATRSRLTRRGAETRARIVGAAADLVYDQGVANTTLDEILEASGTSKSQLYHYFADKDALIREVITEQTRRILAGQGELHRVDSMVGLRRWGRGMVARTRTVRGGGGCPLGSLASELSDQSEDAREILVHCFEIWEAHFAEGLFAMRARAELQQDASPEELATAIMAAIQGGLLLAQTTQSARPLELALDMAFTYVERHLRIDGCGESDAANQRALAP